MGGMGTLIVGAVTTPLMGTIADKQAHVKMEPARTIAIFDKTLATYPQLAREARGKMAQDFDPAIKAARDVLARTKQDGGKLPEIVTANALREIIKASPKDKDGKVTAAAAQDAERVLGPADNYGGRMSFRYVAPLAAILLAIFSALFISDRARGGYKIERIN
jgi:hypothetical protein